MKHSRTDFPDDFLFGVATSAYQIEGHALGGAGPTHWDSFAATPGNVVRGENGDLACDHYTRFEHDLDLVREAGFDCYRFSTSWARVMPEGRGRINPAGLDFYDRLADALLERGLRPCATLYHWELPSALADLGGWRNRDIAGWFADFAEVIMGRIGDRMHSVAPINEPWCVSWLSHFEGQHAPGLRDIRATARAMHHVLLAHGSAIQAMRGLGMTNLGAVFNLEWADPADDSEDAQRAADLYDGIYNRFFLGGVFNGAYPGNVMAGLEPHLPTGWQNDFKTIGAPVDWCGLNYYTRKLIAPGPGDWPHLQEVPGPLPKTQMGWEIAPEALTRFLIRTAREYTGDLPIFVTENGMASADRKQDRDRIDYLDQHLAAVRAALDAGAPVQGYFIWSLLDNFEWAYGYEKRFGLVDVDFETLTRTPKSSFHAVKSALSGPTAAKAPLGQPAGAIQQHWNLVADIGGTNTRLGVVCGGKITEIRKCPTGTQDDFMHALDTLRAEMGTPPRAVVAAAAGPVRDGAIRLTNADLVLSEADLTRATGAGRSFVINDFTAAAWSMAEITAADVDVLQGQAEPPVGTRLVVGPGTGLGVGALLYSGGRFHTMSGEGGHVGVSPRNREEVDVFEAARQIVPDWFFGDSLTVEAEAFLSGTGLPILFRAVQLADGREGNALSAKEILQAARDGSDPSAVRAADMFAIHLATVTGDLAVAVMPVGGVFMLGGVAEKNRWLFGDTFVQAFNAGGRFTPIRQSMNLYVSRHEEFGLIGANNFCKHAITRGV